MRTLTSFPSLFTSNIAPTGWEARHYAKITGGVASGTTLTEAGYLALDVFASLLARTSEWEATISGSYDDGDGFTGTFSGNVVVPSGAYEGPFDMVPYPAQLGYVAHPEVTTLTQQFQEVALGTATGLGSSSSGPWDVTVWLDFRPSAIFGIGWSGPLIVGNDLYIPIQVIVDTNNPVEGFGLTWDTAPAPDDQPFMGTVTFQIPNWLNGGINSLSLPIYGLAAGFSGTASFNIALVPTQTFPYGSEPDNSNAIWNSDGSAISNPLL